MPARREHDDAAFADRHFDHRRIAAVELHQDARVKNRCRIKPAILPEMNLREIAEARIGKRREEWIAKINFREHGVIVQTDLLDGKAVKTKQPRKRVSICTRPTPGP